MSGTRGRLVGGSASGDPTRRREMREARGRRRGPSLASRVVLLPRVGPTRPRAPSAADAGSGLEPKGEARNSGRRRGTSQSGSREGKKREADGRREEETIGGEKGSPENEPVGWWEDHREKHGGGKKGRRIRPVSHRGQGIGDLRETPTVTRPGRPPCHRTAREVSGTGKCGQKWSSLVVLREE